MINTSVNGEMDYSDLRAKLLQNKDKPAIINVTIGIHLLQPLCILFFFFFYVLRPLTSLPLMIFFLNCRNYLQRSY